MPPQPNTKGEKMSEEMVPYKPLDSELRANMLSGEKSMLLNVAKYEQMQRVATMLSKSDFVPDRFRNNVGNCMVAMDMANLLNMHPVMLMRCMYVVHGTPGFEGKFVSALINSSGRYEGKLKYEWKGSSGQMDWGCRAYAVLKGSDERVNGPWIDIRMVKAEGWDQPKGRGDRQVPSKWSTMPEIMFMYRAATFFGRAHDSDLLMGMNTIDELEDMSAETDLVRSANGTYEAAEKKPEMYEPTNKAEFGQTPEQNEEQPEEKKETNIWDYDNWKNLKSPGVKMMASLHGDTFNVLSKGQRELFRDKWTNCKGLEDIPFPFDGDGNYVPPDDTNTYTEDHQKSGLSAEDAVNGEIKEDFFPDDEEKPRFLDDDTF
jgi:hypothetical protein